MGYSSSAYIKETVRRERPSIFSQAYMGTLRISLTFKTLGQFGRDQNARFRAKNRTALNQSREFFRRRVHVLHICLQYNRSVHGTQVVHRRYTCIIIYYYYTILRADHGIVRAP